MAYSLYHRCAHCQCEFTSTDKQARRYKYEGATPFCSDICRRAERGWKPKPLPFSGVCPQCSKEFQSRYVKKYCSMKCYTSSDDFRAMLRANVSKATVARVIQMTGEPPKPRLEFDCLNCGANWVVAHGKKTKFCNHRCYRAYMAGRFDRWMASPQGLALPQSYDEFLSQDRLPCLVDGCDWVGEQLGNHVNFAHGITAEEFKRAAGFNKGTGLITPDLSQRFSERPHIQGGGIGFAALSPGTYFPPIRGYKSLEGREHGQKSRALLAAITAQPPRICGNCGKEYDPNSLAFNSKYCSLKCRSEWYKKNEQKYCMTCEVCGARFDGSKDQKVRSVDKGRPVFCSTSCRQKNNSRYKRNSHNPLSK